MYLPTQRLLLHSKNVGFHFPSMQTFSLTIFQFYNANMHREVKYNVGSATAVQKSSTHSGLTSLNLTLSQQTCLSVYLNIGSAYQKRVNGQKSLLENVTSDLRA